MHSKRVLLYSPYLDTMGGGEEHIFQIVRSIAEQGYEPTIIGERSVGEKICERFAIHFPGPVIYVQKPQSRGLRGAFDWWRMTCDYDILVYVTDGSYFFSGARKTFCFAMVPKKELYVMSLLNRLKTHHWHWIANSHFTAHNLAVWNIAAQVIYPVVTFPQAPKPKVMSGTSPTFLNVGRFFSHLHSKRQDIAIAWFIRFIESHPQFAQSRLILAGGLKDEDMKYFESLQQLAHGYDNITFETNVPSDKLAQLYSTADYYVHFAGWEIDDTQCPDRVEHLGITPLLAMAYGDIAFGYASGGLRETIVDGENGYLFSSFDELDQKVLALTSDTKKHEAMRQNALSFVQSHFSETIMDESVKKLIG